MCKGNHERERLKRMRHSGLGTVPQLGCRHTILQNEHCHAFLLSPTDLVFNQAKFYEKPNKVIQEEFILNLVEIGCPKRRRGEQQGRHRSVDVMYFMLTVDHPRKIKVCNEETFVKVLLQKHQ